MVTSSRRAGRVTNKTKLLIYRGSDKVDLRNAETIVWDHETSSSSETTKHQHVGAKGVESGELLVSGLALPLSLCIEGVFPIGITVKRGSEVDCVGGGRGRCMFGRATRVKRALVFFAIFPRIVWVIAGFF